MTSPAPILAPAARFYRGAITRPDRWTTWVPNKGDILVCTPPKCGTTWTQTILAMLVHGGADLPEKLPFLSPWVDADLGIPASDVAAALAAQTGRRVVKTHTPADGFPIWEGVTVIAVYRHPLDVFFSLRKHTANMANPDSDDPMGWPVSRAIRAYIDDPSDINDFDRDKLAILTAHYAETVLSGRLPDLKVFHYSDMLRDGRRTVDAFAKAVGIDADATVIDKVTEATAFGAMKSKAADYAPVGGTGFWKSDENFFDSASSRKWENEISQEELALYSVRLAELIPDVPARAWLESGGA
jgi:acetyl esterase/lipase